MTDDRDQLEEMRQINLHQKSYYDAISKGWVIPENSFATNLWAKLRHRAMVAVSQDARQTVYDTHKAWLGDLSDKKVLDLGPETAARSAPISLKTRANITR